MPYSLNLRRLVQSVLRCSGSSPKWTCCSWTCWTCFFQRLCAVTGSTTGWPASMEVLMLIPSTFNEHLDETLTASEPSDKLLICELTASASVFIVAVNAFFPHCKMYKERGNAVTFHKYPQFYLCLCLKETGNIARNKQSFGCTASSRTWSEIASSRRSVTYLRFTRSVWSFQLYCTMTTLM